MQAELEVKRYVVRRKTFLILDLDMERATIKKVQKRAEKLPPEKKEVFLRVSEALGAAIRWERLNQHVLDTLTSQDPRSKPGNIYNLQRDINRVLKKLDRWVRTNATFSEEKIQNFALSLLRSSRSICRIFDRNATCWRNKAEEVVIENV